MRSPLPLRGNPPSWTLRSSTAYGSFPYRQVAPYVNKRCYIHRARVGGEPGEVDQICRCHSRRRRLEAYIHMRRQRWERLVCYAQKVRDLQWCPRTPATPQRASRRALPSTMQAYQTPVRDFDTGRFLPRAFMQFGWDIYAPDEKTRKNPMRCRLCVDGGVGQI